MADEITASARTKRTLPSGRDWPTSTLRERQARSQAAPKRRLARCTSSLQTRLHHTQRLDQVMIDALLPRSSATHAPLHATSHPLPANPSPTASPIGPPWVPLVIKGYFKALGGYSIRGSNPAPDIYALTGWIPERLSLREGLQREKEWRRLFDAWTSGQVLVSLGTGDRVDPEMVPLHAYGVLGIYMCSLYRQILT